MNSVILLSTENGNGSHAHFGTQRPPGQRQPVRCVRKAYVAGAQRAGHEVRITNVRDLTFDPILRGGFTGRQALEPDLAEQQTLIRWCQHLVIVTPNWHSGLPGLFKGYVDRVFIPGFGVDYLEHFPYVKRRLRGRSAHMIYTQNTPRWIGRLARGDLLGDYVWRVTKRAILGHCGFKPVRKTVFGGVKTSDAETRARWFAEVAELGNRRGRAT
ncbi:MAG: NAD(P)H-dependent oxidoreductase [Pseudonocardiaceae bacterium]